MNAFCSRLALALCCLPPLHAQDGGTGNAIRSAFQTLVDATHWRQRNAARDELIDFGEAALPTITAGTRDANQDVRRTCQEILRGTYAKHKDAVPHIVAGLRDQDGMISYASAFHLGQHKLTGTIDALRALLEDESASELDARTRYGAIKSLAELGVPDVIAPLWQGLGSDDAYTRYLSNLGILGLTGRDLTAFDYEGPWEGAFVSGPAVGVQRGDPIGKAKKRAARWLAIQAFCEWLETDKPALFKRLEETLW